MRKTLVAGAFAVALTLGTAFAMTRPAELNGTINAPKPYGTASLTWLFLTAYDASLWTDAQEWSMNEPFALTLVYRMSFTTDEIVERTIDEMKVVAPTLSKQALGRHAAMLARVFPAVKSGDRITALHTPGKPVRFFHNGTPTGTSDDAGLAELFFAIWLSPKTSEPGIRAKLLGLKG